ncbi:MAG: putative toxin-antitoxin system toxin component, PIN family [Oscillibacter sp.]|nr:putative toxin-antitoxin system toxin component, PIN family [Oscillibacter sp.]
MKILIDTNILISAIVFGGRPREFLIALKTNGHSLYVSAYIEEELKRIFSRKWPGRADALFQKYLSLGLTRLSSVRETYGALRDGNDIPILSDAVAYDMDVILTGDRDFLEAGLSHPKALSVSMLSDLLGIR